MKTVLIADDEAYLRLLVRTTIESEAYQVLEATDGRSALEMVRQHQPDVLLLDVHMPGLTGLEVANAIKHDPELARTRIIMLTARVQAADLAAGLAVGAERYLTKPFSPIELLTALEGAAESP